MHICVCFSCVRFFEVVDSARSFNCNDGPCTSRGERVKEVLTSKAAIGVSAALASAAALYLAKKTWDNWNKDRKVGLLTPRTAKWQLDQCLLIVDIYEAEKAGALAGRYVQNSAQVMVDINSQKATLSYSVIPGFSRSPFRSVMRKPETVYEHFFLPTHSCFVSAGVEEESSPNRIPLSTSREYVEKGFLGRKRVTALALRVEKSPGLQLLDQSPEAPEVPAELIEALRFKHENTGENTVEQEDSPAFSSAAKDAAIEATPLESLEGLAVGGDVCGGTVLCVESVFITNENNVCFINAAVDDMRRISVLAEISTQTLLIVVELEDNDNNSNDQNDLQRFAAEYRITLPRNCVLPDADLALFSASPFAIDASRSLASKNDPLFENSHFNDSSGGKMDKEEADADEAHSASTRGAHTEKDAVDTELNKESFLEEDANAYGRGNTDLSDEANGVYSTSANGTHTEEDANTKGDPGNGSSPGDSAQEEMSGNNLETSMNHGTAANVEAGGRFEQAWYQHVSIRYEPVPLAQVLVFLKTLPEKLL